MFVNKHFASAWSYNTKLYGKCYGYITRKFLKLRMPYFKGIFLYEHEHMRIF